MATPRTESSPIPTSNPLDVMEELVTANEWRYDRSTDQEMIVEITGQWCEYRMFFVWQEDLGAMYFSCLFDMRVPQQKKKEVAELLAMLNERLWLGHFDLTNFMGIPGQFTSDAYLDAVKQVVAACEKHGKVAGIMVADAATGKAMLEQGFRAVAYSGDLWIYQQALREGLTALRDAAPSQS